MVFRNDGSATTSPQSATLGISPCPRPTSCAAPPTCSIPSTSCACQRQATCNAINTDFAFSSAGLVCSCCRWLLHTKHSHSAKADFMLAPDDPRVLVELLRMQAVADKRAASADSSKCFKWTSLHMNLAEKRRALNLCQAAGCHCQAACGAAQWLSLSLSADVCWYLPLCVCVCA